MSIAVYRFKVEQNESEQRLDIYTVSKLNSLSRSHIQKMIANGQVIVNGKQQKANYKTQQEDIVEITVAEASTAEIVPEDIPLEILYQDDDIAVINKSRGMVVHPAAGNYQGTLVNALLKHCNHLSGINGIIRPGIVHRLDKDTSGVMVVAKNDKAHVILAEQIKERKASRKYVAIVNGNLSADQGIIDAPIGRHPVDRKKMAVTFTNSKEAVTKFHVLERFGNYTFIECKLLTGRTHQIRVHMAHIGHPVVSDPKYGPQKNRFESLISGQALHSRELIFSHPSTREVLKFVAPLPADMAKILNILRNREG